MCTALWMVDVRACALTALSHYIQQKLKAAKHARQSVHVTERLTDTDAQAAEIAGVPQQTGEPLVVAGDHQGAGASVLASEGNSGGLQRHVRRLSAQSSTHRLAASFMHIPFATVIA